MQVIGQWKPHACVIGQNVSCVGIPITLLSVL